MYGGEAGEARQDPREAPSQPSNFHGITGRHWEAVEGHLAAQAQNPSHHPPGHPDFQAHTFPQQVMMYSSCLVHCVLLLS